MGLSRCDYDLMLSSAVYVFHRTVYPSWLFVGNTLPSVLMLQNCCYFLKYLVMTPSMNLKLTHLHCTYSHELVLLDAMTQKYLKIWTRTLEMCMFVSLVSTVLFVTQAFLFVWKFICLTWTRLHIELKNKLIQMTLFSVWAFEVPFRKWPQSSNDGPEINVDQWWLWMTCSLLIANKDQPSWQA